MESAFWDQFWPSASVLSPILLAIVIAMYQRDRERRESRQRDDSAREAALGSLYAEVVLDYGWTRKFWESGAKAAQTGTIATQLSHRPHDSAWIGTQHELRRLGLPGKVSISLQIAYHNLNAVTHWADLIHDRTGRVTPETTVYAQSASREIAEITVRRFGQAISDLQGWAKDLGVDLVEASGFSSYAEAVSAVEQ